MVHFCIFSWDCFSPTLSNVSKAHDTPIVTFLYQKLTKILFWKNRQVVGSNNSLIYVFLYFMAKITFYTENLPFCKNFWTFIPNFFRNNPLYSLTNGQVAGSVPIISCIVLYFIPKKYQSTIFFNQQNQLRPMSILSHMGGSDSGFSFSRRFMN